jgi:hypothetical protein
MTGTPTTAGSRSKDVNKELPLPPSQSNDDAPSTSSRHPSSSYPRDDPQRREESFAGPSTARSSMAKDEVYLPFLDIGTSTHNQLGRQPTLLPSYSPRTISPTSPESMAVPPTVEDIAAIKRDSGSYSPYPERPLPHLPQVPFGISSLSNHPSIALSTPSISPTTPNDTLNTPRTGSVDSGYGLPSTSTSISDDSEPAIQAEATPGDDGTIGLEIKVRHGSRYIRNLSALGIKMGEGKMWDPKRPWGFVEGEWAGEPEKGDSRRSSVDVGSRRGSEFDTGGDSDIQTKGKDKGKGKELVKGKGKSKVHVDPVLPPMSIVIFIVGSRGTSILSAFSLCEVQS